MVKSEGYEDNKRRVKEREIETEGEKGERERQREIGRETEINNIVVIEIGYEGEK